MPHVEKRVTGQGQTRWRIKGVGTFPTRREALEEWTARQQVRDDPAAFTWAELADLFLVEYERTRKWSSYQTARYRLNDFKDRFGDRTGPISRQEAERYAATRRIDEVQVLMNWAVTQGLAERNPFKGLTRRGPGRRDQDPPTAADVDLLASTAGSVYGPAERAFVLTAAYSGLRKGELLGLEWTDLDFDHNRIRVRRRIYRGRVDVPKSNRRRLSALLPEARAALQAMPRTDRRVFPWSAASLDGWWKTIRDVAGLTTTVHELRHFNGHHLYVTLDLPSRVVAAHLGHASPRMVEELYGHFKVGALEEIDRAVASPRVQPLRPVESPQESHAS